jgi:hypothetical protein
MIDVHVRARDVREIDDRDAAAILSRRALVEIRFLSGTRPGWDRTSKENLDRIRFLADMVHNLPGLHETRRSRRDLHTRRSMAWTWNTTGPVGQALMLQWIAEAGCHWTPPPPFDLARKSVPQRTLRQRASILAGWLLRTPPGRVPLPHEARKVKTLDPDR